MTGNPDGINPNILSEANGKSVRIRKEPWDDKTFSSHVVGVSHTLISHKGQLELHSHDLNVGKLAIRPLSKFEVDLLRSDKDGGYLLVYPSDVDSLPVAFGHPDNK